MVGTMSKRRLPPPERRPAEIIAIASTGYTVGSWCPTPDGMGLAAAVAIELTFANHPPVLWKLNRPGAVDTLIQCLLRHKRDVWPESH
jgi:hypothetical protein